MLKELAEAQAAEAKFLKDHPEITVHPLRVAISELRKRQKIAETERDQKATQLGRQLAETNTAFESIQSDITQAFKKFASLYLDEPCDVELLKEGNLPGRKGPQVKAPHAAFFPIISGHRRPSAQALSDAQRSFVDLAFRMAIVEVWRQRTGKTMTMIVETPEGAIDIAYMERVASMLRTFAAQGHTLLITTNLNNDIFLPALLAGYPKRERTNRILNLINLGRPRKVQKTHNEQFEKILQAVDNHMVLS